MNSTKCPFSLVTANQENKRKGELKIIHPVQRDKNQVLRHSSTQLRIAARKEVFKYAVPYPQ
ncbi:hypothetical protein SAMN05421636_106198 [Pricia antarctica]|uniref:Uncharacterized protein n=1 Tax=Pricia antarctica TaxID=641691 RepID=A0A1G7EI27_9FLAO|nr:hypothetical protein SAMN05421636_106198 [Pricia antarctica]